MDAFQAVVAVDDAPTTTALQEARARTLELVAPFSDAVLERVHSTLMSPLAWYSTTPMPKCSFHMPLTPTEALRSQSRMAGQGASRWNSTWPTMCSSLASSLSS